MKIKEITDYLDSKFPAEAALAYDNPGLIAGDSDRTAVRVPGAGVLRVEQGNKLLDSVAVQIGKSISEHR